MSLGNRPIANFGVVPPSVKTRWGSEWKSTALHSYDRTGSIISEGEHFACKGNYMDLGPVYKDQLGDPLLRLTLDWRENERRMAEFATAKAVEIAHAMGAKEVTPFAGLRSYDATRYQSTHIQGGTIMGASPERSVVNTYLQHWEVPNLFVLGASRFPYRRCCCGSLLETPGSVGVEVEAGTPEHDWNLPHKRTNFRTSRMSIRLNSIGS